MIFFKEIICRQLDIIITLSMFDEFRKTYALVFEMKKTFLPLI
jgi:hypothetical protein